MRTGLLTTLVITVFLLSGGHSGLGISYLWGAMISLFSLVSLTVLVPRLLHPNAPQAATFMLSLLLFLKLPFYAIALYLATHTQGFSVALLITGAVLIPLVLAVEALRTEAKPAIAQLHPSVETDAKLKRATQALHAEVTGKRG